MDIARLEIGEIKGDYGYTSYFFSEFPEDFDAKAMLGVFQLYGRAVEVVIPHKRNKQGKRFGFVRFCDVREADLLAIKLDNNFIGSTKIHVNLPRFVRDTKAAHNPKAVRIIRLVKEPQGHVSYADNSRAKQKVVIVGNQGRSYANVLKQSGINVGKQGRRQVTKYVCKQDKANLDFTVKNEYLQRMGKAYVGKVCHPGMSYCIPQEFHRQGIFSIEVTPMGANLVLLESDDEGEINALINNHKEWLLKWFEEVIPWSPRDIDNERLTWVRVYGIPIHAWSMELFEFIVSTFGIFVDVDESTRKKSSFDVARILYRSRTHDLVNRVVSIETNGFCILN